jgi:uncharacterized protein (TIGR02118 family)
MIKFMVVIYRKPGSSVGEFRRYLREVHGPMAEAIPGVRRYVQNTVADDPTRAHPGWDAIVELAFDSREAMEAAWQSAEGRRATDDIEAFADLERTCWSIIDERVVIP